MWRRYGHKLAHKERSIAARACYLNWKAHPSCLWRGRESFSGTGLVECHTFSNRTQISLDRSNNTAISFKTNASCQPLLLATIQQRRAVESGDTLSTSGPLIQVTGRRTSHERAAPVTSPVAMPVAGGGGVGKAELDWVSESRELQVDGS